MDGSRECSGATMDGMERINGPELERLEGDGEKERENGELKC